MLYDLDVSPVALVRHEAALVDMTPEDFLASRHRVTYDGKRRLAYHLYIERDMTLADAAHWLDCDHTTIHHNTQRYRQYVLGHTLLQRRRRSASLTAQTSTP